MQENTFTHERRPYAGVPAGVDLKDAQAFKDRAEGAKFLAESNGTTEEVAGQGIDLVEGDLVPSQVSKRSKTYNAVLKAANDYSMSKYGKRFDFEKAERDYKFASNIGTQNTLKYLNSLTGNAKDGSTGILDQLLAVSDSISRSKFPALTDADAWEKLQTGDPKYIPLFNLATDAADQFAKIMSGGGSGNATSDAKINQCLKMFRTGFSKDQMRASASSTKSMLSTRKRELIGDNRYLQKDYGEPTASPRVQQQGPQTQSTPPNAPPTAPSPNPDPSGQNSFHTGIGPSAPAPASSTQSGAAAPQDNSCEVVSKSPAPRDSPTAPFDKIKQGLAQGFADGSGLTAPNDDPTKLGWGDILDQTWSNIKKSAIHSYENLGGKEIQGEPVPGTTAQGAMNLLAMAGIPFDMIGTGINSMSTSIENGSKQLVAGIKSGDHQAAARGAGQILASLGQIAVGMEGRAAADTIASKAGTTMKKGALVPGRSLLGATRKTSSLYGKDVGKVFTEEPIRPTFSIENLQNQIGDIQHDVAQQVRNELGDPAVNKPSINTHQVIDDAVTEELQALTNESGLKNRPAVIDAIKKLRDDVVNQHDADGNVVGSLKNQMQTPLEADAVKRSIGKNTRWEADPELEQYANSARKRMYGKLNDAIEGQVGKAKPGTSIKGLNGRYANLIEAERLIRERLRKESASDTSLSEMFKRGEFWSGVTGLLTGVGLLESHTGGAAGLGPAVVGTGMLADRAMRSTPGRIIRAQAGNAVGQALESAGKSGVAGKAAAGAVAAGNSGKWIHVQTSDGKEYEVHPEDFPKLMRIDPKTRVILTPGDDGE